MMLHLDAETHRRKDAEEERRLERLGARLQGRQDSEKLPQESLNCWLFITPLGFERFILPRRGGR